MKKHRQRVELHSFKGADDILGAGCVYQLLQGHVRWLRERPARAPFRGKLCPFATISSIESRRDIRYQGALFKQSLRCVVVSS
jgi:hypothetical protein